MADDANQTTNEGNNGGGEGLHDVREGAWRRTLAGAQDTNFGWTSPAWPLSPPLILPPRAGRDTEQGHGRPTEPIRPSSEPKGTEQSKGDDRMLHALQSYDRRADLRTSIGQNQGCPAACLSKPCIPLAVHEGRRRQPVFSVTEKWPK